MTRWTLRILLLLILGVVTTVGVAWAFAISGIDGAARRSITSVRAQEICAERVTTRVKSVSAVDFYGDIYTATGMTLLSAGNFSDGRGSLFGYSERRAGWPLRALSGEISVNEMSRVRDSNFRLGEYLLPIRPILPGFIINTLFYAAIWFVLFFGFGALRRTVRRKRGRCVKCGYDLRGQRAEVSGQKAASSQGCPECGWRRDRDTPNR